jgi:hypothetical protein
MGAASDYSPRGFSGKQDPRAGDEREAQAAVRTIPKGGFPSRKAELAPVAWSHYCDFSLFSLFWPEIYSEWDPTLRRNPGLLVIEPARKQREPPLIFRCFSLFSAKRYNVANMITIHKPLR